MLVLVVFVEVVILLRFVVVFVLLGGWVFGQGVSSEVFVVSSAEEVAAYVDMAASEVLVSSFMVRLLPVAEALRRAMVQRGVQVYLLTTPEGLDENASYAKSLALAGAQVRSGYASGELMIVDRLVVVSGSLVGKPPGPLGDEPTLVVVGEAYALELVRIFVEVFGVSVPFDPRSVLR
jgi:hypothetical protein